MTVAKILRIKRRDQPLMFCPRWKNKAKPGVRETTDLDKKGRRGNFPYIFLMNTFISIPHRNTFPKERLFRGSNQTGYVKVF